MFQRHKEIRGFLFIALLLFLVPAELHAQGTARPQPEWWFGLSGGANLNWYNGTAQVLNDGLTTANPFHRGFGAGPNLALGLEYRSSLAVGAMLYVGYDNRHGTWDDIHMPCGELGSLSTTLSYLSIEPSLRIAPFSSAFYFFVGPRFATYRNKTFTLEVEPSPASDGEWGEMRKWVVSGQVGLGYDISILGDPQGQKELVFSPFVSFQPYFGQDPRTVENWAVTTLRVGAILKILGHKRAASASTYRPPAAVPVSAPAVVPVAVPDVEFSVRAPKAVPTTRRVRETFPLRDYVFFEEGSAAIPNRYVMLTKDQAASFKEEQLQEVQPISMTGRSLRQMTVYYNILNILGDRLKRSPGATVSLSGASENGPVHGKARAEAIKRYLVDIFGIEGSRITTEGRDRPRIPTIQPGSTEQPEILLSGDRRVDIASNSPELLIQVGGAPHYTLRPVQVLAVVEDPLDSHVLFNAVGAKEAFTSWSLEITDEQGRVQRFGPYTRELETISGNTILGGRSRGDYKVVMLGRTQGGGVVRSESSVRLVRRDEPTKEALRFSILFDFDQSKSVATFEKFLTDIVTPLISNNSTVIIHGHTDIVGEEEYNYNLSRERAQDVQRIIERALSNTSKRGVTFETLWFGEDLQYASFDNNLPEQRFYNRTVIIEIVPE
ncbi:MAG: flagellar motor protein MotB [Nitrospiraceae bacterium]|nr:MAG: flagellar motor protein MotB [Nitrospiraceae bacterium]